MIRAIFWKEFREQWVVALAILLFASLALTLMAQFTDPTTGAGWLSLGAREVMPAGLAYLAGAVCGAILLADEKEVGTLEFLDTLPGRRRDLWIGKTLFGLTATAVQAGILGGLAAALGSADARLAAWQYVFVLILVGLVAFGWGMFGGALAKSVLGAVFMGSLWIGPVALFLAVPFAVVFGGRMVGRTFGALPWAVYAIVLAGTGLAAAGWWFTRPDRDRRYVRTVTPVGRAVRIAGHRRFAGFRALVWLSARQGLWITIGAMAAGLLAGAGLLSPDAQPLFTWPGLTLTLGVLAGITVLGEEQVRGAAQFWAERRMPLGRLWSVKVAFHFAIAAGAAFVLYLVLLAGSWNDPFRSRLLTELRPEYGRFLWLGLVYGFVFGHLAGMAFRKTVVAGLVAVVTAAAFAGVLLPAVIGGGAKTWQVWGPAVVLLLTARALLYPWATGRVFSRGPIARAIGGTALAGLVLAAGVGYRVVQIPDVPDRLAASGFEARIPVYDDDDGRRVARAALSQFRTAADEARAAIPAPPGAVIGGMGGRVAGPQPRGSQTVTVGPFLDRIAAQGWAAGGEEMRPWFNQVFAADWVRAVVPPVKSKPAPKADEPEPKDTETPAERETAPLDPTERFDLPPWKLGILEDPRNQSDFSPQKEEDARTLRDVAAAIRGRGIQRLKDGHPVAMLRLVRGGLAVTRTARNMGGWDAAFAAFAAEEALLAGVQEWADDLPGRPDLLRAMFACLTVHEREMPVGAEDGAWADHLILRTTWEQVESWSAILLARRNRTAGDEQDAAEAEAKLIGFAWSVPWERARRERLLRMYTAAQPAVDPGWLSRLHRVGGRRGDRTAGIDARDQAGLALRRATRLVVALHLYRAETGRPAATLSDLVPAYLPAVPTNPFGGAFAHRISNGEIVGLSDRDARAFYRAGEWDALVAVAGLAVPAWVPADELIVPAGVPWLVMAGPLRESRVQPSLTSFPPPDIGPQRSRPQSPVLIARGTGVVSVRVIDSGTVAGRRPTAPSGTLPVGNDWLWLVRPEKQ